MASVGMATIWDGRMILAIVGFVLIGFLLVGWSSPLYLWLLVVAGLEGYFAQVAIAVGSQSALCTDDPHGRPRCTA